MRVLLFAQSTPSANDLYFSNAIYFTEHFDYFITKMDKIITFLQGPGIPQGLVLGLIMLTL